MNLALPLAGLFLLIADVAPGGCGGNHPVAPDPPAQEECDDTASVCIVTTPSGGCKVEQASCSGGVFVCPEGTQQSTPENAEETCVEPDAG